MCREIEESGQCITFTWEDKKGKCSTERQCVCGICEPTVKFICFFFFFFGSGVGLIG